MVNRITSNGKFFCGIPCGAFFALRKGRGVLAFGQRKRSERGSADTSMPQTFVPLLSAGDVIVPIERLFKLQENQFVCRQFISVITIQVISIISFSRTFPRRSSFCPINMTYRIPLEEAVSSDFLVTNEEWTQPCCPPVGALINGRLDAACNTICVTGIDFFSKTGYFIYSLAISKFLTRRGCDFNGNYLYGGLLLKLNRRHT